MSGFGIMHFGSGPYGIEMPALAPVPGGAVLRDPGLARSTGSLRIDPVTRDFVFDEHGRTLGMHDVRQLVFLALATIRINEVAVVSDGIELDIQNRVAEALSDLVNRRIIAIVSTQVIVVRPGVVTIRTRWRDQTSEEQTTDA